MQNFYVITAVILLGYILYKRFAFIGNKNVKNISAEDAYNFIKENKNILILDVRTVSEYKSGHIYGAKSLPIRSFAVGLKQLERYKDEPVIVYCASGGRSPAAVRILLKNGFNNIYHMKHGLVRWKYGLK